MKQDLSLFTHTNDDIDETIEAAKKVFFHIKLMEKDHE